MSSSTITLVAPLKGVVVPLAGVPDPVFSEGALGDGIALDPLSDCLCAPCHGEVIQCARTQHAFTLRHASGIEVLVHLGLDTVALEGQGIEALVKLGQQVESGQPLCRFDPDKLAREATSLITPMVVLDSAGWCLEGQAEPGVVIAQGEPLLTLSDAQVEASSSAPVSGTRKEGRLTLALETGLHARPAARLRGIAKEHGVTLVVYGEGRSSSASSVSGLMNLGLVCGSEVTLVVEGEGAEQALIQATSLLTTPEGHAPVAKSSTPVAAELRDGELAGLVASPGLASGPLTRLSMCLPQVPEKGQGVDVEKPRLMAALEKVGGQLETARHAAEEAGKTAEAEVFDAHLALLDDPGLIAASVSRLEQGLSPGQAWREALDEEAEKLRTSGNEILAGRVADLQDLQRHVMMEFCTNIKDAESLVGNIPSGAIVLAQDLTPSAFVELCEQNPAGLCLEAGGVTSHLAILARARELPCLVAMGDAISHLCESVAVLDADSGKLETTPDHARLEQVSKTLASRRAQAEAERAQAHHEAVTCDGRVVEVAANIGSSEEARQAHANGADGVGLMRSEFLFLGRDQAPSEAQQLAEYQATIDALGSKPLVIRTLDIGADKQLSYVSLPPAPNPAMGIRGTRLWQSNPELLDTQLRALLGVKPLRHLRIMVPMIADASELEWVRERMEVTAAEMQLTELPLLGAMIEVPSAALCAGSLSRAADFLSIGTNDLTQYGLAMDREDPLLAARADVLHPGILRLVQAALQGTAGRCPVAVCGAAAGDPLAGPLLVAMGVDELSVEPSRVAAVKARVRRLDSRVIASELERLLALPDAAAVRHELVPLVDAALNSEVTPERIPS